MRPDTGHVAGAGVPLWRDPSCVDARDEPATRDRPALGEWVATVLAGRAANPVDRVETTVLIGEPVRLLAEDAGWSLVELPDQPSGAGDYRGWMRTAHVVAGRSPTDLVVTDRFVVGRDAPRGTPVIGLGFGVRVDDAGSAENGWRQVTIPSGTVWLPAESLSPAVPGRPMDGWTLLRAAESFLDVPYLWGGACASGVDCSGLLHLVARRFGLRIPRDAHDQATAGIPVDTEALRPGDAVFFTAGSGAVDHVGIAAGDGWLLHAPEQGRPVTLQRLDSAARARLVCARRFVPEAVRAR